MNFRVIGIPEGAKMGRPYVIFFHRSVWKLHSLDCKRPLLVYPKSGPDKPPQAMIVRFHHYQTKEEILKLSQSEQGHMKFQDSSIWNFPDLSAELAQCYGNLKK